MNDVAVQISLRAPALYPGQYTWFLFLSAMDVMLTGLALYFGAYEANILAAWLLNRYGMGGLVLLKFTAVPVVIGLCEYIGRRRPATGRRLAEWVVAISAIPIVTTLVMLVLIVHVLTPLHALAGS
jgi:hypothetical protein